MKTILHLLVTLACVVVAARADDTPAATANATNRYAITGMSCDGCARGLASELRRTSGVAAAVITFSNKLCVVAYDTNRISVRGLKKVIAEAGYEARPVKTEKRERP